MHFRLRIPEDLKVKVENAAAENHRSMTAEIVARLADSFDFSGDFDELSTARTLLWRMIDLLNQPIDNEQRKRVEELALVFLGGLPAKEVELLQGHVWPEGDIDNHNARFAELERMVTSSVDRALDRLADKMRMLGWSVQRPENR